MTKEWLGERIQQALRDARVRINLNSVVARVSGASSSAPSSGVLTPNPSISPRQSATGFMSGSGLAPTQMAQSSFQMSVAAGLQPGSVRGSPSTLSDAQQLAYNRSTSCPPPDPNAETLIQMQDSSPVSLENLVDVDGGGSVRDLVSAPIVPKQPVSHTFSCPVPNEPKEPKKPSRIAIARAGTITKSKAICESDPDDLPNAKFSEAPPPPSKFSPVEEHVTVSVPFIASELRGSAPEAFAGQVVRLPPSVTLPNGSTRESKEQMREGSAVLISGISDSQTGLWMKPGVGPSGNLIGGGSASPPESTGSPELGSEERSSQRQTGKQFQPRNMEVPLNNASMERPSTLTNENTGPAFQSREEATMLTAGRQNGTLNPKNNAVENGGEGSNGLPSQHPQYLNSSNLHNVQALHLTPQTLSPTTPATTPVVVEFPVLLQLRLLKATGLTSHSGIVL